MAKTKTQSSLNPQEIFTTRILILFLTCIGAGGLMWLLRMANYRMNLIFRHQMKFIMPILALLVLGLFTFALIFYLKEKNAGDEKVVSRKFGLYLSIAPLLAVLLPALSLPGKHEQLFSLATELMGCALICYFLLPLFYRLRAPSAAALAVISTFAILCFLYFFRFYYAQTSFILAGSDLMRLTDWGCLLILALLSVGLFIGWNILCKKRAEFKVKPLFALLPLLFSLAAALTLCIHPLTTLIRTILFWSVLGLQLAFFILAFMLNKKK